MSHRKLDSCRTELSRFKGICMATIRTRQRKDGSLAYLSEVRVKRDGEIVHRESRTFERRGQAKAWAETREKRFAKEIPTIKRPREMEQATLRSVLEKYREDVFEVRPMGRSKTSSIRFLEKCDIARMTACVFTTCGMKRRADCSRPVVPLLRCNNSHCMTAGGH